MLEKIRDKEHVKEMTDKLINISITVILGAAVIVNIFIVAILVSMSLKAN